MTPRFRVYDGETMHEPPHPFMLNAVGAVFRKQDVGPAAPFGPVDAEVMLSTGLTDAEGTEIWEGDVIRFYMLGTEVLCRVVWCERYGQWYTETLDGAIMNPLSHILNRDEDDPVVIGNVHEPDATLD